MTWRALDRRRLGTDPAATVAVTRTAVELPVQSPARLTDSNRIHTPTDDCDDQMGDATPPTNRCLSFGCTGTVPDQPESTGGACGQGGGVCGPAAAGRRVQMGRWLWVGVF